MMSILLVIFLLAQILLGFATLGSGSEVRAWIHFLTGLEIFGLGGFGFCDRSKMKSDGRGATGTLEGVGNK